MNKGDRKELNRALELINEAREIVSAIRDQEEEKYDNLPEGFQDSERGEKFQENIDDLDSADSGLEEVIEYLENCINR